MTRESFSSGSHSSLWHRSLSREKLLYSNSYALSQNYGVVHIVATLSYNIPISKVDTLFLSADLASFVVAVSEMARVWPVKTSELLSLLLNEGRALSQNRADININYYQKRQYITIIMKNVYVIQTLTKATPGVSFEKLTVAQCPLARKRLT